LHGQGCAAMRAVDFTGDLNQVFTHRILGASL
jgi:hypothetical protein